MKYKNPRYKVFSAFDDSTKVCGPYILQRDGTVVIDPTESGLGAYSQLNLSNRFIASTYLNFKHSSSSTRVSTVFLCIDHRFIGKGNKLPVLFETTVFDNDGYSDTACKRTGGGVHQALRMHMRELSKVLYANDIHVTDIKTLFQISTTQWQHSVYWINKFKFKRNKKRNNVNSEN